LKFEIRNLELNRPHPALFIIPLKKQRDRRAATEATSAPGIVRALGCDIYSKVSTWTIGHGSARMKQLRKRSEQLIIFRAAKPRFMQARSDCIAGYGLKLET
jgi:hypothetical protein